MRSITFLAAAALVGLGIVLATRHSEAQAPLPQAPSTRETPAAWEYRLAGLEQLASDLADKDGAIDLSDEAKLYPALENGMNRLGEQGWEFCHFDRGSFIFKRRK